MSGIFSEIAQTAAATGSIEGLPDDEAAILTVGCYPLCDGERDVS